MPAVAVVFSEFVTVTRGKEELSKVAQPRVSVSTGGKKFHGRCEYIHNTVNLSKTSEPLDQLLDEGIG